MNQGNKKLYILGGFGVLVGIPVFNRLICPEYFCKKDPVRRAKRTAIVTGATGDLGAAITIRLAQENLRVIMACRDMDKCKSLRREIVLHTGNKGLLCRRLDLEDINSINEFADNVIKTEPHIDILINNAAEKKIKEKEITKYGIEKNYFINFLAPFLLTFKLLDKLKESAAITRDSRIINVLSIPKKNWEVNLEDINFDKRNYNAKKAYRQSKLALAYFTILLNDLNREEKNFVYVYGTSPCYRNIGKPLHKTESFWEYLKVISRMYYAINTHRAAGSTIQCAIDDNFADPSKSGRLYTYLRSSWGWGDADKNLNQAKVVWNSASQTLLNIPLDNK